MRTRTIDVEINSNSLRILRYKQYDHNNILEIFVTKDKEFLDLSSYAIRALFTLPNNTVIQKNAIFKDKKIIITIDSVLLERHGRIPVEITMSNGNEITTIFRMYLEVEESIDRNSAPILKWVMLEYSIQQVLCYGNVLYYYSKLNYKNNMH